MTSRIPLVYLGTPEPAVPPLHALVDAGHDVRLVVTRPDRRRGRGSALSPSPVKRAALSLGLSVTEQLEEVSEVGAALGIVVAFGRIIPAALLRDVPMLNLHFSLLPRWRGAAPVERAILAGDDRTGVCVMTVDESLDTGGVHLREEVTIGPDEHLAPLRARLVEIGSRLLVMTLAHGLGGIPVPEPQRGTPSHAPKLTADELELRWDRPAEDLARLVRLDRAWTTFRGRRLGVLEAIRVIETEPEATTIGAADFHRRASHAGTLHGDLVMTSHGALQLLRVHPEGGRAMDAEEWVRGARLGIDERLGT